MEVRWSYKLIILLSLLLVSCSGSQKLASTSVSNDSSPRSNYYTSAFPAKDVTELLKEAQQSVVRIVSTGFYDSFTFDNNDVTLRDIRTKDPHDLASISYSFEESTAGTSIILDQNDRNALLITCEHTISFPDTTIVYYEGDNIPDETYIRSINIRKSQNNLVYTGSELKTFGVISSDRRLDLALLNVELERNSNLDQYPLAVESGDSNFLKLGSFLYVLGFPKGYAMVTRGLASSSESWNDRFFVTDASFNRGISGGLILASNDNFNSFQWVGMASSSDATRENILVPRPNNEGYASATQPYTDSVFVQRKTRINYGITQAIPINKIKDFLLDHQQEIRKNGFRINPQRLPKL